MLTICTDRENLEAALKATFRHNGIISGIANRLYPFRPTNWGVAPLRFRRESEGG